MDRFIAVDYDLERSVCAVLMHDPQARRGGP
jgi:hypothetical protein